MARICQVLSDFTAPNSKSKTTVQEFTQKVDEFCEEDGLHFEDLSIRVQVRVIGLHAAKLIRSKKFDDWAEALMPVVADDKLIDNKTAIPTVSYNRTSPKLAAVAPSLEEEARCASAKGAACASTDGDDDDAAVQIGGCSTAVAARELQNKNAYIARWRSQLRALVLSDDVIKLVEHQPQEALKAMEELEIAIEKRSTSLTLAAVGSRICLVQDVLRFVCAYCTVHRAVPMPVEDS